MLRCQCLIFTFTNSAHQNRVKSYYAHRRFINHNCSSISFPRYKNRDMCLYSPKAVVKTTEAFTKKNDNTFFTLFSAFFTFMLITKCLIRSVSIKQRRPQNGFVCQMWWAGMFTKNIKCTQYLTFITFITTEGGRVSLDKIDF